MLNLGFKHRGLEVCTVCSNDDPRKTFDILRYGQICILVAVAILKECCMASADMQILFYSDERIVAHGPLVFCCC